MKFSNGGQYFAAVNANSVQVYKTYTCEMLASFIGHNNRVRSISWTPDDSALVSCGMDGAVFEFRVTSEGGRRVSDWAAKGVAFSCVAVAQGQDAGA